MLTMMDLMEGSHSIRTPEQEARKVSYQLWTLRADDRMGEMYTSDCAGHDGQWVVDSEELKVVNRGKAALRYGG